MVLLTVSPATKAAIDKYCSAIEEDGRDAHEHESDPLPLSKLEIGSPIEHRDLIALSNYLVKRLATTQDAKQVNDIRLDSLLKGAKTYQPPPPPKKEPTPEYKALMRRLREEEEQRQYERMLNPPHPPETFGQRFPNSGLAFNPATSHGASAADEIDDVTYADVHRQIILIINVLISIICCSVAIWIAARHWSVPQRLGLSFSGSGIVAIAEVAIYMGYIQRIKDAKGREAKKVERKEIVETWVTDRVTSPKPSSGSTEALRFRKGKRQ